MKIDKNFLLALTGILLAISLHFILFEWIFEIQKPYFQQIYIFILIVFVLSILAVQLLEINFKEQLGYFFLVVVAVKLLVAKLFVDRFDEYQEPEFKFSLLGLYLISLIFITWFTANKLLNSKN